MVCLYHSFELSHLAELAWIPRFFSPEIAVNGFFIISGFLITLSHDRSSGTKAFFRRRFFRIYPAYIVVVLASSIGLLAFSSESGANYFNNSWAMYVFANAFLLDFIQPTLPGVFVKNIFQSINGSLWTIKVEAFLYATVPLVAFFSRKVSKRVVLLTLYLTSTLLSWSLGALPCFKESWLCWQIAREVTSPLSYFLAGAIFYRSLVTVERHMKLVLIGGLAILLVNEMHSVPVLAPLGLAAVIMFTAFFYFFGAYEKFGDFSFGIYITHFPIAQIFLIHKWPYERPIAFLFTVLLVSLTAAFLLWRLIERRFLSVTNPYLRIQAQKNEGFGE